MQSRRRAAPMRKARSKDRPWTYLRHEFHGGALRGSGGGPPGLTENRRKGSANTWSSGKKIKTKPVPPLWAQEHYYHLKLFTIRSKTGGCISAGGGVAATSWLCIVCRQSGRISSVEPAHTPGGNLIEGAGIYRRTSLPGCSGQSRWGPEKARESTK